MFNELLSAVRVWIEHRVDDEGMNGGIPIRGGDGFQMADMDGDGRTDIVSVHEDSNHLRIAFATDGPDVWVNVTIGEGAEVAAIIAKDGFEFLDAPVQRVAAPDVPSFPYNPGLEDVLLPGPTDIVRSAKELSAY